VCCVLFERRVLFCVLGLTVIPLPPDINEFSVKLNIYNYENIAIRSLGCEDLDVKIISFHGPI
jgi:hypothetical protein